MNLGVLVDFPQPTLLFGRKMFGRFKENSYFCSDLNRQDDSSANA
jgi:hypothetical protein